jgi:hypothetical protein
MGPGSRLARVGRNERHSALVHRPARLPQCLGATSLGAFDPSERPKAGDRSRDWTARAETELGVVREMGRCLREISAGRTPG